MFYFLAMAQPSSGTGGQTSNPIAAFMPLILMFIIFYVLLIVPQRKKQKEHQKMLTELKKGDKIVTTGGIHGVVVNLKDDIITIKVAENVKIDVNRGNIAIARKGEPEE